MLNEWDTPVAEIVPGAMMRLSRAHDRVGVLISRRWGVRPEVWVRLQSEHRVSRHVELMAELDAPISFHDGDGPVFLYGLWAVWYRRSLRGGGMGRLRRAARVARQLVAEPGSRVRLRKREALNRVALELRGVWAREGD